MEKEVPGAKFFLFSNDPDWTREHFKGETGYWWKVARRIRDIWICT